MAALSREGVYPHDRWVLTMIWVSRGRGGWALFVPLILFLAPLLLDDYTHWMPKSKAGAQLSVLCLLLTAGLVVAVLGFWWNRGSSAGRRILDSASGLEYIDRSARHSFYLIPMQYWGLFYSASAVALIVVLRS